MADSNIMKKRKSAKNIANETQISENKEDNNSSIEPPLKCAKKEIKDSNLSDNTNNQSENINQDTEIIENEKIEICEPSNINENMENEKSETIPNNTEDGEDITNENQSEHILNDSIDSASQSDPPIITITFLNNQIFEKYKLKFINLLMKIPELKHSEIENEIHLMEVDSSLETVNKSKKKKSKSKAKTELFVVDTTPNFELPEVTPKYNSKFKVMNEEETSVQKLNCFNCDGNHNLRDCTEPRNMIKIKQNRAKFKPANMKTSRYHLEEDQKYAHLVPGKISDKLRNALGLRKNEYPAHIYKMRQLGYPPGWLEEAKIVHSNLSLYDIEGKNVKTKKTTKDIFDPNKIIDYPGFNVKPEKGIRDDAKAYGVPYYYEGFSKEAMLTFIKNLQENAEKHVERSDTNLDENIEQETPEESSMHQEKHSRNASPSLIDLETKKKELLAELEDDNGTKDSPEFIVLDATGDADMSITQETKKEDFVTPNKVKHSVFGTPIIKSSSPYLCLPNTDNFAKEISPLINFENLPNSTGKYEQMATVLNKVRKSLKDLQEKT